MSSEEVRAFLAEGTRTAKVATVRKDGSPHVTPVWFVLDGDDLVFTTGHDDVKARNLRRNPRIAIAVDDQMPPYSHVRIDGAAEISEDLDELREWATRIGGRYMGEDRAEEFGRRNAVPSEILVRVRPTRVTGESGVAA
jgi:PPOX class probable F420-dependent enzyme